MDICEHQDDRFGCHLCAEAWLKNMKTERSVWKGMSSSTKRGFSPSVPAGTDMKSSSHKNGSGPPPLKYSSAPVDDVNMNEVIDEQIELSVTLPGGKTTVIPVDSNIPMQDLRVLLAAKSKVSPTGYTLVAISEETGKSLDYKANQTIGSLDARTIHLVSKQKEKEAEKAKLLKRESTSKILQPFETTYRFTINLPRNQKMVMRISPETNLGTVYANVCKEKHLDPRRFTLQHPANPQSQIDMKCTVADIRSNEINLVPLGLIADSARSMPDLSRSESLTLPKDSFPSYMPGASEPKKKRGFLSFLKRKDNKFKVHETKYSDFETSSTASHQMNTAPPQANTPPAERHVPKASADQVRPKSMFVTAKELKVHEESVSKDTTLPRPTVKKKRAPPPPQQKIPETVEISVTDKSDQAEVSVKDKKPEKRVHAREENVAKSASDHVTQRLHSRNSSDSSGYHELTLSGAESPEANRVSSNFKTSIDTTSIESADNTNGDSGINEHSPVHSSPKRQDMTAGDSKTLPLPKSSKKAVQRSHSFEKKDKSKQGPVPSTKKRRAPAPPPGAVGGEAKPPPSSSPPSHSPDASQDTALDTSSVEISHKAAVESTQLTSKDNTELKTIKLHDEIDDEDESFDINDTIDGLMMMVEDQSIASEDIDNIEHAKPPPTFIAPPPPVEPPPPQTPEAETVDVGTEVNDNASLGPSSEKSSPRTAHSRTNSSCSVTSVNTIEDLNLAFEQTIAMATEALENEEQESELQIESGYKNEMAMFVEKMSHLTEKADSEVSDTTSISLPDTESNSETGSVIRHDHDQKPHHLKLDSLSSDSGSVQKFEDERSRGGSTDASGGLESSYDDIPDHPRLNVRRDSIELRREKSADNAVSEIDVPVDTLPPPPEFRNEAEDEDEDEEEYRESVEEIVVTMPSSSTYTFGGAYKIPDYETPKEHQVMPDSPRSRTADQNLVYSTFEINGQSEAKTEVVEKPKPPRVKEEFVITKEELAKIKYFDDSRVKPYVKPAKRPTSLDTGHVTQVYQSDNTGTSYPSYQSSYSQEDSFTNSQHDDNVKSRCSELSFQPSSEGEIDNVLEEKSISMIALPAMRTSVLRKSDDEYLDHIKQDNSKLDMDQKMRKQFLEEEYSEVVQAKPVYISGNTSATASATAESSELDEDEDLKKQQAALHAQYDLLQQQFTMWQQQLEQNQKLLAAQNIDPDVQNMQQMQAQQMQMQMQMQQQMMAQLQKSMDALSLQQKNRGEASANTSSASINLSSSSLGSVTNQATVNPVSATVIAASSRPSGGSGINAVPAPPPPPPPPAPAALVASTAGLKKASDRPAKKNDPRFERKLDPREELMIAIRSFGERGGLKKVPIQKTHWHEGSS